MLKLYNIGNKFIFCNNSLIIGSNALKMFVSYFALLVGPLAYLILELRDNENSSNYKIGIFVSITILELFAMMGFFLAGCTDPGVLKVPISDYDMEKNNLKLVEYKNKTYALKFCNTCNIFRPLRGHHCRVCDVCIEELDHHCLWIGNCVGRRNRRKFLFFLVTTTSLCCEIFVLTLIKLISLNSSLDNNTITYLIVFLLFSGFLLSSLSIMLGMQIFLIFIGMTTNEYLRGIYTNITNPFNKGIFENLKEFFWKDNSKKNIDEDYLYRKDLSETQRSEMGLPKISKENTTNLN